MIGNDRSEFWKLPWTVFESMSILLTVVEAGSLSAAARRLGTPLATVRAARSRDLETHPPRPGSSTDRADRITSLIRGQSYVAACQAHSRRAGRSRAARRPANTAHRRATSPSPHPSSSAGCTFSRSRSSSSSLPRHRHSDHPGRSRAHILEDHVDLAIRIGELPGQQASGRPAGSIRRVVCGSPAYFAAPGRRPKSPAELGTHDCITSRE